MAIFKVGSITLILASEGKFRDTVLFFRLSKYLIEELKIKAIYLLLNVGLSSYTIYGAIWI